MTRVDADEIDVDEVENLRLALGSANQSGKSEIVTAYEVELATRFGAGHAVAVNSGSAAIEAALVALGAGPGTRVLVSAAAPLPTLMPILATGAAPEFIDCLPLSPAMDAGCAARALDGDIAGDVDGDIVAAVEVPLWGYPLDNTPMTELLATASIPLVEDASHAHGALAPDGRSVGTHGVVGCFSTHHMKMLSTGEGGFVLTGSAELAQRIRTYCRLGDLDGTHDGRNYKPSAFTAAIGRARLAALGARVRARRRIAEDTLGLLAGLPLRDIGAEGRGRPNGYNLVVALPETTSTEWRRFHQLLAEEGLSTDPIRFRYSVGYSKPRTRRWRRDCPNAERLVWRLVQLPTAEGADPGATALAVHRAWERWGP